MNQPLLSVRVVSNAILWDIILDWEQTYNGEVALASMIDAPTRGKRYLPINHARSALGQCTADYCAHRSMSTRRLEKLSNRPAKSIGVS